MAAVEKYINKKIDGIPFRAIPESLKKFWAEHYELNKKVKL